MIFTPHERRALVFGVAFFCLGLCLQVVFKMFPAGYRQLSFLDRPLRVGAVDVNHASYDELLAVSGIGPSVAARIVYAREKLGRFKSWDELRKIKGFSPKSFLKARPHLVIVP